MSGRHMKKRSRTNWDAIDALRDDQIDHSESPELGRDFFARAVQWPGKKRLVSLRLDPDVLEFFQAQGKGYQTAINSLLRRYMEAHQSSNAKRKPSTSRQRSRNKRKTA